MLPKTALALFLAILYVVDVTAFNQGFTYQRLASLLMAIAPYKKPRAGNAPGNLFVDESCIDCDVCRWMCPSTFHRKGVKSAVKIQPESDGDKLQAYAAMIACPVGAIRTHAPDSLAKQAFELFPAEIDQESIPGIMHLGFHSAESYGATPYLVRRTLGGNIMIDVPRFNERLAQAIEAEGRLLYIILTHKDDVADHDKWAKRFPTAQRIIHRADVTTSTADVELQLEGEGTWKLAPDLMIIHTPGHTAGSICILVQIPGKDAVLFTGDHLAYSASRKGLEGFKRYNQGNIVVQAESIKLLASEEFKFKWLLPGHGRMTRFASDEERMQAILAAAENFDKEDETLGMLGVGYY